MNVFVLLELSPMRRGTPMYHGVYSSYDGAYSAQVYLNKSDADFEIIEVEVDRSYDDTMAELESVSARNGSS